MNDAMTLITRFVLDPKGYEEGAKLVEAATHRVGQAVTGVTGGILSGLQSALRTVFSPIAALAGGAGLLSLAHSAVETAISFDTIQRSLEAITGTAERAKAVMDFGDKLAGPSIFTAEDLDRASVRLEAFGLRAERYLPSISALATVFGASKETLMEFTDALGELAAGRAGRAMMIFERAGISRHAFEAKGVTFDKGGEMTSSASGAVSAANQIIQDKYGKLAETMANGPQAKLASLTDSWERALRRVGVSILTVVMPAAEKLQGFIQWLVDSGTLEKAINGLTGLFSGKDIGEGLVDMAAWLVATLQNLPSIVNGIGVAFHGLVSWLRDNFIKIGEIFVAIWTFDAVMTGLRAIQVAIKAIQATEEGLGVVAAVTQAILTDGASLIAMVTIAGVAATAAAAIFKNAVPRIGDIPALKAITDPMDKVRGDHDKLIDAYHASKGGNGDPLGDPADIPPDNSDVVSPLNDIANHAQKTARNTSKMAEVQDKLLGGSGVGKGAGSAVNVDKYLKGTGSGGGDKIERAVQLIREAVAEHSGMAVVAAAQQGRSSGR